MPKRIDAKSHASVLDCAERLRVVADPTRLAVMRSLTANGPQRVAELNDRLDLEQSLLSHHLRVLRDYGLVETERDGKGVRYRIAKLATPKNGRDGVDLGCCTLDFDRTKSGASR